MIDPAFLLTNGSLTGMLENFRGDDIGAAIAHELGHAWPVPAVNEFNHPGLRHTNDTCFAPDANVMGESPSAIDGNGDTLLNAQDGISFDSPIPPDIFVEQQVRTFIETTCQEVDQRAELREHAPDIPGCKIIGTNDDCSTVSDLEVDELGDVAEPEIDLSSVRVSEPEIGEVTQVRHELTGRVEQTYADYLAYYTAFDLDDDPTTGGAASDVGMPTEFAGAELVAEVFVEFGEGAFVSPTVWKFQNGTFEVVNDSGISARISAFTFEQDSFSGAVIESAGPDSVLLTIPNAVRGPRAATYRLQAVSLAVFDNEFFVSDRLDDTLGEPGKTIETTTPTFPTCTATPNPVGPGGIVAVDVAGLVPNQPLNLFVGPDPAATGMAAGDGSAHVTFPMLPGLTGGNHLITVGTRGTTLTADCFVELVLPPQCVAGTDKTRPTFSFVPPDVTTSTCVRPNIGQAAAQDACGARVSNDAPGIFPLGTTIVTWRAVDPAGNVRTATQRVTVTLGDDARCCPAGTNVIVGTPNNDTLNGTPGADCILGLGAQDTLNGFGGNDVLSGGDGDDVINAGDGDDVALGGSGQDRLNGGSGNDSLSGGDGDDICRAGSGNDTVRGGQGQDDLFGEIGNDQLFGDDGDDDLFGDAGNDHLAGGANNDRCNGGSGANTILSCEGAP